MKSERETEPMKVRITDITVGERRRTVMGDIAGLASSIAQYGLIHPIVLDDAGYLIAGGRRLAAVRDELGHTEIEARRIGELTKRERHEIELEENLQRKDLTEFERSRLLDDLVQTAREIATETCADSAQVSKPARGPSKTPGSYRDISERIGVPEPTIRLAEKHVAAAEKYPELQAPGIPQEAAITMAKTLDSLPEEERAEKRAAVARHDQDTLAELAGKPPMPKGPTPAEIVAADPGRGWSRAIHDVYALVNSIRAGGGLPVVSRRWSDENRRLFLRDVGRLKATFEEWESFMAQEVGDVA